MIATGNKDEIKPVQTNKVMKIVKILKVLKRFFIYIFSLATQKMKMIEDQKCPFSSISKLNYHIFKIFITLFVRNFLKLV
jgi:hypothetical protein